MTTDRQLLEDAARAAGIEWQSYHMSRGLCLALPKGGMVITQMWNPLNDDGDALRLACYLGLRIYPVARTASGQACSAVGSATSERLAEVVDATLDTRTATRRAIVRAAAAIGRKMREAGNA